MSIAAEYWWVFVRINLNIIKIQIIININKKIIAYKKDI